MRTHINSIGFDLLFEAIGALARRRRLLADKAFGAIGLTHTEARILSLLHEHGGEASQDQIAAKIGVDRTNVGRAFQRLETQGLVARTRDPSDGRAKQVALSKDGARKVTEIQRARSDMAATFFGELTEQEATEAARLLQRALVGEVSHGAK